MTRLLFGKALTACFGFALLLCSTGCLNMGSPLEPSTPEPAPAATTAILTIRLDGNCAGRVATTDVYVDGSFVGTIAPGGSGVAIRVAVGNHTIFGQASNGQTVGPLTKHVGAGGYTQVFTCS